MFLFFFLALSFSVILAIHASVLSSDVDSVDPTATFRGISFSAKATPNSDKGSSDNHTLENEFNMEYTGKVNVGGHGIPDPTSLYESPVRSVSPLSDFTVIIDTGSSDLWVISGQKLRLISATNTTLNITYGLGSAYGNVAYAPVSFGGYQVDNQAFLVVSKRTDQDAEGILGLGLDGLSAIERTVKNSSAQSVMANMFAQHSSTSHLIGLALERTENGEETAGGFLTIGEYDPQFSNVTYMPKNPVTPTSTSRWTVAMEGMTIDGIGYNLKSAVKGTKKGQAIALIDSGTSLAYIPNDAVNVIYSRINGSVHVKTADQDAWFVPCLGQTNLSFTFASVAYAINPLELTSPVRVVDQNNQYTICINAFRPPLHGTDHDYDFLLGDVFMRNVYAVFNFGNVSTQHGGDTKDASVQFLSRTNRDQVYADFQQARKESLRAYPPLFDLAKLHADGTTDDGGRLEPPPDD